MAHTHRLRRPLLRRGASRVVVLAVVCAAAFAMGAGLRSGAARPSTSIAIVDVNVVINSLTEFDAFRTDFESRVAERRSSLQALEQEIEALIASQQEIPATDTARRDALRGQIVEKQATLRQRAETFSQQSDVELGTKFLSLYAKFQKAASDVAQREGFDLVFLDDRSIQLPERASKGAVENMLLNKRIIHATDGVDISQQVLTLMNNEFDAGLGQG